MKDYQESFDLEDNEDNGDLIFVRGGVYDVNKKNEGVDLNKGMIYNFKGENKDEKINFKDFKQRLNPKQITNESAFNAENKFNFKGKLIIN